MAGTINREKHRRFTKILLSTVLGDIISIVFTNLWKRLIFRSLFFSFILVMLFLVDTIDIEIVFVYIIL